jgi:DNA-binding transcriptional regulator LsrR (DeoR family)
MVKRLLALTVLLLAAAPASAQTGSSIDRAVEGLREDSVYIDPQAERALDEAEAVGEVLIAPFDLDGRFVCDELRQRVIAFDGRRLGRVATSIGVGSGESKVRPILGALRAGLVKTLVTDVATAEAVVALDRATLARPAGIPR